MSRSCRSPLITRRAFTAPAAEHLQMVRHYAQARPFLAGLPVGPTIEVQATLDEDRSAFLQILLHDFRRSRKSSDVDERRFLLLLTLLILPDSVDSEADISNSNPFRRVSGIRVTGQVTGDHYFI
jgi:hypothetical protein